MQDHFLHLFLCTSVCFPLLGKYPSYYWEGTLPAIGKASFLLLGKRLSCYWESVFPATGKASFLLLGKHLSQ